MSRIAALLNRDGHPADSGILQRLIAPMRHSATDGPRYHISGAAGLAYQCLQNSARIDEHQPVVAPPGIAVCFDGRLDNREELIHVLAEDLGSNAGSLPDASLVLACYRRFGEMFASYLNGDYALALFDHPQRRLLLARDVVGVRPLYYWASHTTAVAASEIKAILAHPEVEARPDDRALADFLMGGNPSELRLTCFHNVVRVLPGCTVVIMPARVQEFRHWDFDTSRQIRLASVGEYAEALRHLFEQSVRRRLRAPGLVAVLVSGGLDSSAILCQAEKLRQAGAPVAPALGVSMVFPEGTPADEKQYLRELELHGKTQIRRLPFASFEYVDDAEWIHKSEWPRMPWNAELERLRAARELGCTCVLNGEYGDQMMSSYVHLFALARSFRWLQLRRELGALAASMTDCPPQSLRRHLLRTFIRESIPNSWMYPVRRIRRLRKSGRLPSWFTKSFRDLAFERSLHQRRLRGRFASKQAERCYRYFRAPYVLNPFEENNKAAAVFGLEKAYPFLDRDLVQFMMAVPAEVINLGGVFKGLFREAMRGILPEAIRLRRWKADFTALDLEAAAKVYSRFRQHVTSDCLSAQFGYLDVEACQAATPCSPQKASTQGLSESIRVNSVVGLELWLRAFFSPAGNVPS